MTEHEVASEGGVVRWWDRRLDPVLIGALLVFEALLFSTFFFREVAWYYPVNYDQSIYLLQSYGLEQNVLRNGLGELWKAILTRQHPTGVAFPVEGAVLALVIGGDRYPRLCVNFIAFGALQVVAFTTAREVWRSRGHGYVVLGLILCQNTAWFWAGGLFDFRMDFLAYCLYGTWACIAVRSCLFLVRSWAIACGFIGALLILNRFITSIYFVGVYLGFAVVCIGAGVVARSSFGYAMRRRLLNLFLSFAIVFIIAAPAIYIQWDAIRGYYGLHASGDEPSVRAAELGIADVIDHLLYYPQAIVASHWGSIFLWASAIAICFAAASLIGIRPVRQNSSRSSENILLLQSVFLLGAIVGPVVVLTADISKSPVVGGIVGVPAALLVTAACAYILGNARYSELLPGINLLAASATVVLAMGILHQLHQASQHLPQHDQREAFERVRELDRWLANYASEHDWVTPKISFDIISPMLNGRAISVVAYEASHRLVEFQTMLGGHILGVEREQALSLLADSDFAIMTTLPKQGVYPFYHRISQYWSDLKARADENMLLSMTVPVEGFTAMVYVRPSAVVKGISGGWITSSGLVMEASRASLQKFPIVRLVGAANSVLPKLPTVSATVDTAAGPQNVAASFQQHGDRYEIRIDTLSARAAMPDQVRLHLMFDTFFVPKNLGINSDTRELVMMAPTRIELVRAGS